MYNLYVLRFHYYVEPSYYYKIFFKIDIQNIFSMISKIKLVYIEIHFNYYTPLFHLKWLISSC